MRELLNTNFGKAIKSALYLVLSAAVSSLITFTSQAHSLFGPLTLVFNFVCVLIEKTFFDNSTPNFKM